MYKTIDADEVLRSLPIDQQQEIERRGAELLARIERRMTLKDLRRKRQLSQAGIADALGIGQMQISRLEQRSDPRISTLQKTVAAMGGSLTMLVTFPNQDPVVLVTAQKTTPRATQRTKPATPKKTVAKTSARAR